MTNDLIDRLVAELTPVNRFAVFGRVAFGAGAGILVSFALMAVFMGVRPDLASASYTSALWVKFAYTLGLAACGVWAVNRLSRPAGEAWAAYSVAAILLAAIIAIASFELTAAPVDARALLVFGGSASVCPWLIALLSTPVLAGLFWAMRGLAPTQSRLAGLTGGLAAGAIGAWIYAFHCTEAGAPFLAIWYTAGIVVPGIVGAALAPRIIHW